MQKRVEVNGDKLRREREKRAWTQEDLSERTALGVRTLRRLEAGHATLETIKRVNQALESEPAVAIPREQKAPERPEELLLDPLVLELAPNLVSLAVPLIERMGSVRRHLAKELGIAMPGVRFVDQTQLPPGTYRILIRGVEVARDAVQLERILAVGRGLPGVPTLDPTYGLPAAWLDEPERAQAESLGAWLFDCVSVIATHLTERVRTYAHRLLGIEDVHELLQGLRAPRLLEAALPHPHSVVRLRAVLRYLLEEQVSIRDLVLILETLADHPDASVEEAAEAVRRQLGAAICQQYANSEKRLSAVVLTALEPEGELLARLLPELERLQDKGLQPILLVPDGLRPTFRRLFRGRAGVVVLAQSEVAPPFEVLKLNGQTAHAAGD